MKKICLVLILCTVSIIAQTKQSLTTSQQLVSISHILQTTNFKPILPGAGQTSEYLSLLKGKRVAIFANQTSVIGNTHLVDTLTKLGINIIKIFAPEHGFRGTADAGENIKTYTDTQTGISVISLYGSKLKPSPGDLNDVDILLFDIQDVGVRFYTYIGSLQYFLESAMENNKPLIILDRPNPNGFYVDGPVLDTAYRSFVGMQPIPVVYGMTLGEYAKMLLLENWICSKDSNHIVITTNKLNRKQLSELNKNFKLIIVPCKNYTHKSKYVLPIKPSPNLPDMGSIYWYPSICFFEGTVITEGRGTDHPFQIFGHPALPDTLFSFTPHSTVGAKEPKFKDQLCYGWNVYTANDDATLQQINNRLQLKWLLQAYHLFSNKENFFLTTQKTNSKPQNYFFNKLAGNNDLMQQIVKEKTEEEIRKSWQLKLDAFKKIRKKYLLYADFY